MMSKESEIQTTVIRYLKSKGCYTIKTRPGPGTPKGCPDILFMLEGFWGAIEAKAGPNAKYQPLQKETLDKFEEWSWARRVDPSNWPKVREELELLL